LSADVKFQGKIISLILAHPTVPIKQESFINRNKQLAAIGEYAAQVKNPLIVVGDLNTTMWSPFYKNMVKTGNCEMRDRALAFYRLGRLFCRWLIFRSITF
jgi:endonuclease/exonuclease/phosphatase (EEP) superfamily protein YafD